MTDPSPNPRLFCLTDAQARKICSLYAARSSFDWVQGHSPTMDALVRKGAAIQQPNGRYRIAPIALASLAWHLDREARAAMPSDTETQVEVNA